MQNVSLVCLFFLFFPGAAAHTTWTLDSQSGAVMSLSAATPVGTNVSYSLNDPYVYACTNALHTYTHRLSFGANGLISNSSMIIIHSNTHACDTHIHTHTHLTNAFMHKHNFATSATNINICFFFTSVKVFFCILHPQRDHTLASRHWQ